MHLGVPQFLFLPPFVGEGAHSAAKQRTCGRKGGLSATLLALILLFAIASPLPAAEQLTGTSAPDSTYGEGGTKQTFVDAANALKGEVWRDKTGMIREQHELETGGDEFWGFFIGEGTAAYNWGGAIEIKPISGPAGAWTMTIYGTGNVTIKEYGFLTQAELDTEFAYWRGQMRGWVNGFIRAQGGNG